MSEIQPVVYPDGSTTPVFGGRYDWETGEVIDTSNDAAKAARAEMKVQRRERMRAAVSGVLHDDSGRTPGVLAEAVEAIIDEVTDAALKVSWL